MSAGWSYLYGVLVLLSLLSAAFAITLASQAGEPGRLAIPPDINKQVQLYTQVFNTALTRLSWARLLAAPAVLLLVLAIGVRWYAPRVPDNFDKVRAASQERVNLK